MYNLTLTDYLHALVSIKEKLISFKTMVINGNSSYLEDLSLKLRILYIKKSGTDPLFKTVFKLLKMDFQVWVSESLDEEMTRKGKTITSKDFSFFINNEIQMWFQHGYKKVNLIEALERINVLKINDEFYSSKQIIEIMSDRLGGAHFDSKLKDRDILPFIKSISIGENNLATHFIISATEQTITAITMIEEFIITGEENEYIKIINS